MLTIGKIAERVGIRSSAIRYYERQGMVQPALRGSSGYRFYSDEAVSLLLFVKRAQALGITLKEIKPLLKRLARSHLREIEDKIRQLQALRNELRTLLRRKVTKSHASQVCPLIESGHNQS